MKAAILILFLVEITYAQNMHSSILGVWEKILENDLIENKINVGELVIYDDELKSRVDKQKKKREKDFRYSKHYLEFKNKEYREYHLGLGRIFNYKIVDSIIFINKKPFYDIKCISSDTLKIFQIGSNKLIRLKRKKIDLSDLDLIKQ